MNIHYHTSYSRCFTFLWALLFILPLSAQVRRNIDEIDAFDEYSGRNERFMLPEGMLEDLDSLLHEWHNRSFLTPMDCDCDDVNPEFDKETYIHRLSRLPNVIEMPYNEVVRKFIDQYTGRLRRSVSLFLAAGNFYIPIFEEALDMYQLPLELKYLPIIESALKPSATSRAGAVGLWQFMITTGKMYGLEVTSLIDERRDPIKSSYAAARYLKDLYDIFGDWTLVIAAYNCGPNNVRKAISRAQGEKDYWKIYPYLPAETRGYVPAFIAANYAMNYFCEHNICPMGTTLPTATDTVNIHQRLHFEQIMELCHISHEELRALNPQYSTDLIPGDARECTLRLPVAAMSQFVELGDSVYHYRADELLTVRKEVEVKTRPKTVKRGRNSASKRRRGRGRSRSRR